MAFKWGYLISLRQSSLFIKMSQNLPLLIYFLRAFSSNSEAKTHFPPKFEAAK
jgi:hypothetical protein